MRNLGHVYRSAGVVRVVKCGRVGWAGNVATVVDNQYVQNVGTKTLYKTPTWETEKEMVG
jgi:hypothetical protein